MPYELLVTDRFLDWIEILTLKVLHQRHLDDLSVIRFTNDGWNLGKPGYLCRSPPAFPGDEFEHAIPWADHKWLDDPLFLDRGGQIVEGLVVEILSRLK